MTPNTLEVGVPNGTQGWLKIRAEVGGEGDVSASLSAATSAAQESLHRQLPALNAYLHSEQMSVATSIADRVFSVSSASLAAGSNASTGSNSDGSGRSFPQGTSTQDGATQHGAASDGSSSHRGRESYVASTPNTIANAISGQGYQNSLDPGSMATVHSTLDGMSGRWLNVRA